MKQESKLNFKAAALMLFPLLMLFTLTISADIARESCISALKICGRLIIPSLFPFFILSGFMTRLGLPGILGRMLGPLIARIYKISPAGASALPMGLIGGYPNGAAYIAELEKDGCIDADEGERLIAFCNNSGPAFIIGAIGSGIFSSASIGLRLYMVHIFSALVTGLFFRGKSYSKNISPHRLDETNTAEALVASVKQAISAVINVCGFVICFSVLIGLIDTGGFFTETCSVLSLRLGLDPRFTRALLYGILELGSAAGTMQGLSPSPLNLAFAAGILGWGGLSVHFQTLAVLSQSKIKGTLHIAGRLISAFTAFFTMLLISG